MNSQTDAIRDKEMVLRTKVALWGIFVWGINGFGGDHCGFVDEDFSTNRKARRILRRAYLYGSPAIPRTSDTPLRKSYLYIATCSKKLAKNLKIEIVFVRNKWGDKNQLY